MKRNATAVWQGSGKEGKGSLTTQSTTLKDTQYSYLSRFESGTGTNPEELCAAAHAGCFSMKLAFVLGNSSITPDKIETRCDINFVDGNITESHLTVTVAAAGLDKAKLDEAVADAKANCPISKLFNTNITAEATLA